MKERGILFSASMVQALLDGSKSQTRRTINPPPADEINPVFFNGMWQWATLESRRPCPYGVPGDRLWVREAWRVADRFDHLPPRDIPQGTTLTYEADGSQREHAGRLRPGMFMPRRGTRLVLEVTDIRVESLQDISAEDAMAEGITHSTLNDPRIEYRWLWESINGVGSWSENPWVWAVSFRLIG